MMKRFMVVSTAVALCLTAAPRQAQAQMGFGLGASAGVTIPSGDLGDIAKSGYNVKLILGGRAPLTPVGFRIEGGYDAFQGDGNNFDFSIRSGTANVVLGVPMGTMGASPYVIGGVGVYNTKVEGSGSLFGVPFSTDQSESRFGWNIGGGLEFGLGTLKTFVEARYHAVSGDKNPDFNHIPISFGIMF